MKILKIFLVVLLVSLHILSVYFSYFYFEKIFFFKINEIQEYRNTAIIIVCILLVVVEVVKHFFTTITFQKKYNLSGRIIIGFFACMAYSGSFFFAYSGSMVKVENEAVTGNDSLKIRIGLELEKLDKSAKERIQVIERRKAQADTLKEKRFKQGWSLTDAELKMIKEYDDEIKEIEEKATSRKEDIIAEYQDIGKENNIENSQRMDSIVPISITIEILILLLTICTFYVLDNLLIEKKIEQKIEHIGIGENGLEDALPPEDIGVSSSMENRTTNLTFSDKVLYEYTQGPKYSKVREMIKEGMSIRKIHGKTKVSLQTIQNIKHVMEHF